MAKADFMPFLQLHREITRAEETSTCRNRRRRFCRPGQRCPVYRQRWRSDHAARFRQYFKTDLEALGFDSLVSGPGLSVSFSDPFAKGFNVYEIGRAHV